MRAARRCQTRFLQFAVGLESPGDAIGKNDIDFFNKDKAKEIRCEEADLIQTGLHIINNVEKIERGGFKHD